VLTADLGGGVDAQEVWLREEDPFGLDAELADLRLRQLHLAAAAASFDEAPHHLVQRGPIHRPDRGPRHHHLAAATGWTILGRRRRGNGKEE
jgi:hypothetical protein